MKNTPLFVPLVARRWPAIGATSTNKPHQSLAMPLNCLLSLDGACFYLPGYVSFDLLKQDFPGAEVLELEMPIEAIGQDKLINYSVKMNLDGQLTGQTTTIEIPRLDAPPLSG